MSDIDLNTFGLNHNPDLPEHMRRMGRSLEKLDNDGPIGVQATQMHSNTALIAATEDRSGTLESLDGYSAVR